ncbi:Hemolysin activation/secretion protein [Marinobacter persicus]|uniref:Hemolysin activation/secretion protein n=1 Tax=Marinobacter persicus TaxID=930118 RepID=A0A1I3PHA4_9GAMM|nr:ShlB/FhaC/HecB family hemolysin secretion/activation protein [Marinobacter persicus]GHD53767.1 hypothetical protein GCM10008110_27660 [Marinobacter persicus]SFJ20720.1 Hemolysin activation/secretion protein [Marinobacter persicus]
MRALLINASLIVPMAIGTAHGQQTIPADRPGLFDPGLDLQDKQQRERDIQLRDKADEIQVPALRGGDAGSQQLPETGERFVINAIGFNPSVYITEERLKAIASQYTGRTIGFEDLNALLDEINAIYQEKRQLTSRAVIPPQDIGDGRLKVVLVEARLEGVAWTKDPEQVPASFFTERIRVKPGETLDTARLLNDVQRLNATTPGPQLSVNLEPGSEFGTSRLALEPFEPEPWGLRMYANNYGSESSGEYQAGLRGKWFSPTNNADTLSATVQATEGTIFGDFDYRIPVNRYNGEVFAGVSRNQLEILNGPYRDLEIEGESMEYRLGYEQPWWLNRRWTLTGGLEYLRSESETTLLDGFTLSETTVDSFRLTGTTRYREGDWFAQYQQIIDTSSTENQVNGATGNYQRLMGNGFTQWRWTDTVRFVGKTRWQWASAEEDLPSTLLFQLGGLASTRGYESGILAAPHGIDLSLEGHWAFTEGWELSMLIDAGHVVDDDLPESTITSAGLGLGYNAGGPFSFSALYAGAFNDVVPEQDSGQLYVQLQWRW